MTPTAIIKSAFRYVGCEVVRYVPQLNRPFSVLPLLVREHLASAEPFFFVQVGANDGVLDDPLRDIVLQHHLPGLLIEPLPDMFESLRANYKGVPDLIFENVAVGERLGSAMIYRVKRDAVATASNWHGIASFSRRHLKMMGVPDEHIESCQVPLVTLAALLERHGIERVSLLQVDTEGYDFSIVKSTLQSGVLPRIINYEHRHLSPTVQLECKQLLDNHGYRFIDVGPDTLAVRQSG